MLVLKKRFPFKKNYICVKLSIHESITDYNRAGLGTELCFKKKQQLTVSEKLLSYLTRKITCWLEPSGSKRMGKERG
jgi:hypothetical protein